jgi:predicted 3-demethylubiquinone-9 3-methyltransferase (glyoxalase superfamily)
VATALPIAFRPWRKNHAKRSKNYTVFVVRYPGRRGERVLYRHFSELEGPEHSHYGEAGQEMHQKRAGTVMTVAFELDGQAFTALNGGPMFKFNEAISFQVDCGTQEEVDYYWEKLSEGGDEKAQQCGWLKDKYGVSWQIVPGILIKLLNDPDAAKSQRVMGVMLRMKKIDIDELKRAYAG